MACIDQYSVNAIRLYMLEDQKKIRVRNCTNGTETDYSISNTEVGLKVTNGTLSIGSGVLLNNPTKLSQDLKIYKSQTQAFFGHIIDPNADDTTLIDEASDVEFFGAGDDRDECELTDTGKPKTMYRFRLSKAPISILITNDELLELRHESDASAGIEFVVTTNMQYIN